MKKAGGNGGGLRAAQAMMQKLTGGKKYRKGSASKTRKGRKNFITHKGSKKYNRKGHRQSKNKRGTKKRPY
tara:strand:+ start:211 stop:423 length:213 start_codon:yes stop_codon:yes gene_type:complete